MSPVSRSTASTRPAAVVKNTRSPYRAGVDQLPPAPSKPISLASIDQSNGSLGRDGSSFISCPTSSLRSSNRWYSLATYRSPAPSITTVASVSSPVQKRNTRLTREPPASTAETSQPCTRPPELAKYTTPSRSATEPSIETSASPRARSSSSSKPGTVATISGATVTSPISSYPR